MISNVVHTLHPSTKMVEVELALWSVERGMSEMKAAAEHTTFQFNRFCFILFGSVT